MTNLFLKAKHWQLFLMTFGIAFILQIVMMASIFMNFSRGSNPDPSFIFSSFIIIPIITLIFASVLMGWFWSVATGLQKNLPQNVSLKIARFKIFFFIPLAYMLLVMIGVSVSLTGIVKGNDMNDTLIGSLIGIIIPLHLFSMFCMLHTIYFVAKTFKTVELQRKVSFSDFAGEFFMVWFFPVGIWIIQPKLNRFADEDLSIPHSDKIIDL